ncbi:putative glutathione S-transferase [Jatrophihabitans endophyticus]|uniref:Putative glutathione S-transferase n=1 Tax=Jatrophihabitans endophyticus TaxID=1206085 RepID=A0A1M5Q4F8_9ACTN|nr:glutathione S-transferase C-terminal domain-containing protein [Jatrophihabitans endophyticus]SHH08619.1 putative glutathione S-transferase [Jatrophihabitans endophyticus]
MSSMPRYADPADVTRYGEYRVVRDDRPLYRFAERVSADGRTGFRAEPGRYHVYAGWFCPWSQRVTIELALNGLTDVVSVSYVDGERDGRGWAFRERHGPDSVNDFALLREAYDATEPGFDGHVSVPTLWDRATGRVVSNDYRTIGLDLATEFAAHGTPADTYPVALRERIDRLDAWLGPAVNHGVTAAATDLPARAELLDAFEGLDDLLGRQRYLTGDTVTEADVRLWVTLVRFDAQHNAGGDILPEGLPTFPELWDYARDLYRQPAFAATTDFAAFAAPGARSFDWSAPER